jgi:hypothetical protein
MKKKYDREVKQLLCHLRDQGGVNVGYSEQEEEEFEFALEYHEE